MEVLGIDIGGTGIKGAPVHIETGELTAERHRILTPQPATPESVLQAAGELIKHFNWNGPIGCGFPAVVKNGVMQTAANVDASWIGADAVATLKKLTGKPAVFLNDADAAGLAELRFGAGKGRNGLIAIVTLGTGIGTAFFVDGTLIPNTELGHIELRGKDAERRAAESVRIRKNLTWKKWAKGVNEYFQRLEALLWPDLIIVGGGGSKNFDKFAPYLSLKTEIVPAQLLNEAGIVGAALAAVPATPARRRAASSARATQSKTK
ncbi:MAG: ROK family protein [candidate division Zixibacteria bacterium]|nr:ROK family protein [candidate division Zixibacteria bacterium]